MNEYQIDNNINYKTIFNYENVFDKVICKKRRIMYDTINSNLETAKLFIQTN